MQYADGKMYMTPHQEPAPTRSAWLVYMTIRDLVSAGLMTLVSSLEVSAPKVRLSCESSLLIIRVTPVSIAMVDLHDAHEIFHDVF